MSANQEQINNFKSKQMRMQGIEKMLLRDYFAAKALPDLIAGYSRNQGSGPYLAASPDEISHWAYLYADAMLKAREE